MISRALLALVIVAWSLFAPMQLGGAVSYVVVTGTAWSRGCTTATWPLCAPRPNTARAK